MIRYYITDRLRLGGTGPLLHHVARLGNSVDCIQVREKDLSGRALAQVAGEMGHAAAVGVRVLLNDRADIAIACGCAGVHLRGDSISPSELRRFAPQAFLISVACHSVEEVRRAAAEGADMALLSPIFTSPGKSHPLGLERLAEAARAVRIPVLALGGVTAERMAVCQSAGAGGIAGIRLFQPAAH